jgi:hypothetical protein
MRKILVTVLLLCCLKAFNQSSQPYQDLKTFAAQKNITLGDSSFNFTVIRDRKIDYLFPLFKAFRYEPYFLSLDTATYLKNLAQAVACTGDYATSLELNRKAYDKSLVPGKQDLDTITTVPGSFSYTDAKKFILNEAKKQRLMMINEAHDKPLHRAFTASLLEELYRQGFRYLAMEMLSNRRRSAITSVDMYSGYYVAEPMTGELIRKAIQLGYTLVPYEDTAANHSVAEREYTQAENLSSFLQQHDSTAKLIVYAGYGHIEENDHGGLQMMATWFKKISGINPFTIDQTQMTETSFTGYMSAVYDAWIKKHPIAAPSIALSNDKPYDIFGLNLYDITIIHPPTKYINGRPSWITMNGERKETAVSAAFKTAFLLQAYYADEYKPSSADISIPADQTYVYAANGLYYLYLKKGKYKLVFRDKEYKLLGSKDIAVDE